MGIVQNKVWQRYYSCYGQVIVEVKHNKINIGTDKSLRQLDFAWKDHPPMANENICNIFKIKDFKLPELHIT